MNATTRHFQGIDIDMNDSIKYYMTKQLRTAGKDEDVIKELLKIVDEINTRAYRIDLVIERIFNEHHLWKFISLKVIIREDIKIDG